MTGTKEKLEEMAGKGSARGRVVPHFNGGPIDPIHVDLSVSVALMDHIRGQRGAGQHPLSTLCEVIDEYAANRSIIDSAYSAWASFRIADEKEWGMHRDVYERLVGTYARFGMELPSAESAYGVRK